MDKIKQNSPVLFYFNHSKKWLMKISKKESLHTHIGVIKHSDAIGKEYGSKLTTNKDKYVYLLRPTMYDYVMKIQHGTQIVYPKDLGYIVARSGIGSGQKILEIGTGSGSLTSFIANIVKPRGHVYTFDVNEDFMKIAEKNIKKAGVSKYITQHNLDLKTRKKMPLEDIDVALIDLGDPWTVIPQVRQMLKGSGAVFAICPTMNQLEKRLEYMSEDVDVAVIGCYVNGPGESKQVSIGVTGASPKNLIYIDGKPDHKIDNDNLVDHLESLIREKISKQKNNQNTVIAKSD